MKAREPFKCYLGTCYAINQIYIVSEKSHVEKDFKIFAEISMTKSLATLTKCDANDHAFGWRKKNIILITFH